MKLALIVIVGIFSMTDSRSVGLQTSTIENGFRFEDPLLYIKDAFVVTEKEKPIVSIINEASTSIAYFAKEIAGLHYDPSLETLHHVLPESRTSLRLPPKNSPGLAGRYVNTRFYCWKLIDSAHLQVNIEWGDAGSSKRYIDSYVFKNVNSTWFFEKHGDMNSMHFLTKPQDSAPIC